MIYLRKACIEDLALFSELEQSSDARSFVKPNTLQEHTRDLAKADIVYLRIEQERQLLGFFKLAIDPDGESVEFRRIVIGNKGQGVGQQAITAMENYCRAELGRQKVWLNVFFDNDRGRHIYQKMAYREVSSSDYRGRQLFRCEKTLLMDS